jgi:hypothetical protein
MPHTPGPWEAHGWGDDEYDVHIAGTEKLICSLHQEYDEETGAGLCENIEADARLIAAAPELYRVLLDCGKHMMKNSTGIPRDLAGKIMAVIAKVEVGSDQASDARTK